MTAPCLQGRGSPLLVEISAAPVGTASTEGVSPLLQSPRNQFLKIHGVQVYLGDIFVFGSRQNKESSIATLTELLWSGTKCALSLRYAYTQFKHSLLKAAVLYY